MPIRDVCNRQRQGNKTEPHYENLTENWCSKCMNGRIKSVNRAGLEYVFLMTRYWNDDHERNGKLLVVGFLYRAKAEVWRKRSRSIPSMVERYESDNPETCGFFAGDEKKSHFVSAAGAYPLKGVRNARWKYFADEAETNKIVLHLKRSTNILPELRRRVRELRAKIGRGNRETSRKSC